MRKKLLMLTAIVVLSLPLSTKAQEVTGQRLSEMADAFDRVQAGRSTLVDGQDAVMLLGYIVGVNDSYAGTKICYSGGVTNGQLMAITIKYVRAHPEFWNLKAHQLVMNALKEVFPCK